MKRFADPGPWMPLAVICATVLLTSGCRHLQLAKMIYEPPPPQPTLGTLVDPVWKTQETSAEASEFVVYQHEFGLNTARLNMAGEDHVKQIAYRLHGGQDFPVVIERSMTSVREGTEFEFPVHPNPELDMQRREVIVRSLAAMGVPESESRVVVAPAYAPGYTSTEAIGAYNRGLSGGGRDVGYGGGFGGGFGRFGGFGGFGF